LGLWPGKDKIMSLHDEIRSAQVRAGEDAVIRNLERLGLATVAPHTDDGQMFVLAMANRVCQHLPDGWELRLCMDHGAAWVELSDMNGDEWVLPDAADKTLEQQVNDALCVARGW
jgi:hypothetical protein